MLNYKIIITFIISIFAISIGANLSYSQMPPHNSASLPPEYIVKKFMTMGGELPINDSQLTGIQQGIPSNNNTNINNISLNTPTAGSYQTTPNNLDFPKIYNSIVPSIVEVTAYNTSNHTIFKTGTEFIYNLNGIPTIITVSNLVAGKNDITVTFSDGSSYYSNLTGYDPLTNVAILCVKNISQNKLVSLQLGNS